MKVERFKMDNWVQAYKDICVTAIAIAGIQQLEQIVKELSGKVDELESRLV